MIQQLQTLPGGFKLGDITGVPDLLPPDWNKIKNMSVWDALQEAMDKGNQLANLPRPSLGPGGLGIVDPHFGNDPRMDIPDILDALHPITEGIGSIAERLGGGAERTGNQLDLAYDLARAGFGDTTASSSRPGAVTGLTDAGRTLLEAARSEPGQSQLGYAAQCVYRKTPATRSEGRGRSRHLRQPAADPERSGHSLETIDVCQAARLLLQSSQQRVLRQADSAATQAFADARATPGTTATASTPNADVTATLGAPSTNDTGTINDIVNQGQSSVANGLSRSAPQQAWDGVVRQLTDSGTDLNNIEKEMGRRLGRPLTDSERVGLLARVDPTHQASTMVEEMLGPALRDIKSAGGQSALDDFHGQNGLVENRTNKSVAEGQAKLAEQNYLEGGIPQNTSVASTRRRLNSSGSSRSMPRHLQTSALSTWASTRHSSPGR